MEGGVRVCGCHCVGVGEIVWMVVGVIAWVRKGVCGWDSLDCCRIVCLCVGGEGTGGVCVRVLLCGCGCDCASEEKCVCGGQP